MVTPTMFPWDIKNVGTKKIVYHKKKVGVNNVLIPF